VIPSPGSSRPPVGAAVRVGAAAAAGRAWNAPTVSATYPCGPWPPPGAGTRC